LLVKKEGKKKEHPATTVGVFAATAGLRGVLDLRLERFNRSSINGILLYFQTNYLNYRESKEQSV